MSTKPKKVTVTKADQTVEEFRSVAAAAKSLGVRPTELSKVLEGKATKKTVGKLQESIVAFSDAPVDSIA